MNPPYPQSAREAWNLAMQKIPNKGYGNITETEVTEIIQYPPVVTFEQYQHLKSLGKEIMREEPDLKKIKPDVTRSEVFFYLTRGFLPNYPNIRDQIDRIYELRHFVAPFIRGLLMQIYGSERNYAMNPDYSPLEELLLAYNQVMGIPGLVTALASANDMNITGYDDADIGFITEIEQRIPANIQ